MPFLKSHIKFVFLNKLNKMENQDKNKIVSEPETLYETKQEIIQQKNTPKQEILLKKLLAIGLKESEMGLGRPHKEVWAEMKLKYNFK
jgi:hypothetical protein